MPRVTATVDGPAPVALPPAPHPLAHELVAAASDAWLAVRRHYDAAADHDDDAPEAADLLLRARAAAKAASTADTYARALGVLRLTPGVLAAAEAALLAAREAAR